MCVLEWQGWVGSGVVCPGFWAVGGRFGCCSYGLGLFGVAWCLDWVGGGGWGGRGWRGPECVLRYV